MNIKKYITEFIGAFFLVATIGFTVMAPGADHMAPLAIGSALMVMIFAGGHISGAHYNPAVTLAVWLRGRCETKDMWQYMAWQIAGGSLAGLLVTFVKGGPASGATMFANPVNALIAEFLFTFALAYVVLNVATAKANANNSFYGLAIGFTVLTGAYAVGNISGGAFNPAVAFGISIMGLAHWGNLWAYLLAEFLAAAAAAYLFNYLNPNDK